MKHMKNKIHMAFENLKQNTGISTIEIVLIIVVLIAVVVIFKSQLTSLVSSIFEKIASESSGI